MSILPERLNEVLREEIYTRNNSNLVRDSIDRLGVDTSAAFQEFYTRYEGPFWEGHVPFELLDLVEEENNIESYTYLSRREHGFLNRYLVLSEMSANAVLVLDSETDKVYTVNFEGEDELLFQGAFKETWPTFWDFLKAYFNC
ncbi:SMI1/KNR4 family protein [Rossellomorea vietnamensis]|uniref:SMI1/KNR4 family protein n=1 Tax=Rossellomorea vietnamensis TaxID=218284 RepID=UPI001E48B162|nr:SMI1/KNR4 family protein [Rossellomorea vietnamensis]MCC5803767.1 SMI1/KNR4 family protein [Rossellomorea vietnamensis]